MVFFLSIQQLRKFFSSIASPGIAEHFCFIYPILTKGELKNIWELGLAIGIRDQLVGIHIHKKLFQTDTVRHIAQNRGFRDEVGNNDAVFTQYKEKSLPEGLYRRS